MTKLEKELQVAILDNGADYAKAAAEVAKKYIEMAFDAGNFYTAKPGMRSTHDEDKERWLKENGVTGEVNS